MPFQESLERTSLVVQWLRLLASNAGAQVQVLVGKLLIRSHMLHGQNEKKKKLLERTGSSFPHRNLRKPLTVPSLEQSMR